MENRKNYPLHPGQTIADPYFVQIPMEEFERLKALDRNATEGGKNPESENETLKNVNAKLQDEIARLKIALQKQKVRRCMASAAYCACYEAIFASHGSKVFAPFGKLWKQRKEKWQAIANKIKAQENLK